MIFLAALDQMGLRIFSALFGYSSHLLLLIVTVVSLAFIRSADAQRLESAQLISLTVHGESLANNLSGESPDRDVKVYLPPSYEIDRTRRYPVVFLLHGYLVSNTYWTSGSGGSIVDLVMAIGGAPMIDIATAMGRTIASGNGREMILVMPDARTRYAGSMYSTSVTIGDWEGFIAEDLVGYMDQNFRTLARRESRGIAGHSMGGYGAIRIGMKRPDVFSSIYSLSACCLMYDEAAFVDSDDDTMFVDMVIRSVAAAWSPNPEDPPEYFDRPGEEGVDELLIAAKWAANSPLAMVDQYIRNLRRYRAIALDVGSQDDESIKGQNEEFARVLAAYELGANFEMYEGDHTNRIAERMERNVIPFFSQYLDFD